MQRRNPLFDKTLLRYVWSFLLVLLLPSGIFFLVHDQYFFLRYQDEVTGHFYAEIDNLDTEIVSQIQWMRTIAGQLANQQACQRDNIREDAPNYSRIINTFISIVSPQKFFSVMSFYSRSFPDTVFTNHGTYNLQYYKQYAGPDGEYGNVRDMTENLTGEKWFTPEQMRISVSGTGNTYDFVIQVPRSDTDYVIFTIPEQNFRNLAAQSDFIILDQEGRTIYATFPDSDPIRELVMDGTEASVKLGGGKVLFRRSSPETGLYLGLLFPEETFMQPIRDMQHLFLLIFLVLLVLGGALVFFLAMLNYAPIRRLSEAANRRVGDIPQGLSGIHAVDYALESMGGQMSSLQESVRVQHAVFGLIYGRDEKNLQDNLRNAGLPEAAGGYCAVLVYTEGQHRKEDVMEQFIRMLASAGCSACGMEYLAGSCYLFLVAYMDPAFCLIPLLEQTAEAIEGVTGSPCRVIAGKQSADAAGLRVSFRQAMQVQQGILDSTEVLAYKDEDAAEFFYPNLELQALYLALVQLDTDKFSLMYQTLADTLQNEALPSFTAGSVYCDMINFCLMGIQGICPGAPELKTLYAGLGCDMDVAVLAGMADRVRHTAVELAERMKARQEEADGSMAKIFRFIDDNYRREDMNVSYVAHAFGLSVSNLSHRFKTQTGTNISDYIREKRLQYTKELLREPELTVSDIAARLGYAQPSNFIRKFKSQTGMTPNEYRSLYGEGGSVGAGDG